MHKYTIRMCLTNHSFAISCLEVLRRGERLIDRRYQRRQQLEHLEAAKHWRTSYTFWRDAERKRDRRPA